MFADHIAKSRETRSAWADRLGISKSFLSDLLNGNRTPSLELAVRIERMTEGAVPAACWIPLPSAVATASDAEASAAPSPQSKDAA